MAGGAIDNTKFEYAIRACMLLTKIALTRRDNVGVFTFSDKKNFRFLETGSGDDYFYRVLDFVAKVKPEGKCKIFEAMDYFVRRYQKRSLIFLISDLEADSQKIADAVRKLIPFNHTVIIINPFSPWFEVHEINLSSTDKALAEAISEEMMEHILKISQKVKRMGVRRISVGPDDMMDQVIRQYLDVKKKGQAY
jgi:uncharacterized protein (DUF58 family)